MRQLNSEFSRRFAQPQPPQLFVLKTGQHSVTTAASSSNLLRIPSNSSLSTGDQQQQQTSQQPNLSPSTTPILACHRLKVTFKDEPGEGSGVARSFITAFSLAVLENDTLPDLAPLLLPPSPASSEPSSHSRFSSLRDEMSVTSRLLTRLGLPHPIPTPPAPTRSRGGTTPNARSAGIPLTFSSSISINLSTTSLPPAPTMSTSTLSTPSAGEAMNLTTNETPIAAG